MAVVVAIWVGLTLLFLLSLLTVDLARRERRSTVLASSRQTVKSRVKVTTWATDERDNPRAYLRMVGLRSIHLTRMAELPGIESETASFEARLPLDILSSITLGNHTTEQGAEKGPTGPPPEQDREVRVAYSRRKYIGQAFHVIVSIGGDHAEPIGPLPSNTEQAAAGSLRFLSPEKPPQIQVELQFAAGEFIANRTKDTRTLPTNEQTDFDFLVKPLKAEDCLLTVVISLLAPRTVPEHPTQRTESERNMTDGAGRPQVERGVGTVFAPETMATQVTPLWTADLVVSVNQIFGMNASTLGVMRALIGVVAAALVVAVALITKKTDGWSGVVVIALAAVNVIGAPVYDGLKTLMPVKKS